MIMSGADNPSETFTIDVNVAFFLSIFIRHFDLHLCLVKENNHQLSDNKKVAHL